MYPQKRILSTKCLSSFQKERLSAYEYVEERFIKVDLRTDLKLATIISCAVFTSQNAVKAVFRESKITSNIFDHVFCVGDKTAKLLESFGISVVAVSYSAEELATLLIKENSKTKITFFCGNLRRDELPDLLRENEIDVEEIEVYQTHLLEHNIQKEFDGILFFSPSAVKSYVDAGNSVNATAFCIGNTTAVAAIMEFEKVYVADSPSIEAVIQSVKENIN